MCICMYRFFLSIILIALTISRCYLFVVFTFIFDVCAQIFKATSYWSEIICYFKEDYLDCISNCLQAVSIFMWAAFFPLFSKSN